MDVTITDLPVATGLAGQEVFPADKAGNTVKVSLAQLLAYMQAGIGAGTTGPAGPAGPKGDKGDPQDLAGLYTLINAATAYALAPTIAERPLKLPLLQGTEIKTVTVGDLSDHINAALRFVDHSIAGTDPTKAEIQAAMVTLGIPGTESAEFFVRDTTGGQAKLHLCVWKADTQKAWSVGMKEST